MTFHILNGDALIERFLATELSGKMIVVRECLIEGDLGGETLSQFYLTRARYIEAVYNENEESYYTRVVSEFEKLMAAPDNSEFNLWFGYDLFCRMNMFFILSILHGLEINKKIFSVYPSYLNGNNIWKDYAEATSEDLINCFNSRRQFSEADLKLGKDLWTAFKTDDFKSLETLSKQISPCFPYLQEICSAHIDRFPKEGKKGRPERAVEEIIESSGITFNDVFNEFSKREGIYGFGDCQVKPLYDKIINNLKK